MRYSNLRGSWLIVLVGFLSSLSLAQQTPDIRELEPDQPIERELAGGDVQAYSINLTAGQFLGVIVDQRGIDVIVTLFAPDGKQLTEVDSPNGARGPEPISVLAKASGNYRIEVRSSEKAAAAGRYEVKIEALRVATPADRKADSINTLAATLAVTKTKEERAALLTKEKELLTVELWKALDLLGQRQAKFERSYAQAINIYRTALNVAEQFGYTEGMAGSLNNIGTVYRSQNDNKQALEFYQRSLPLSEASGDKKLQALVSNNIGWMNFLLGNYVPSLEYDRKSLKLHEELGNKTGVAGTLNRMSLVYRLQGDFAQALEYAQRSLTLSKPLGNKALMADVLMTNGLAHGSLDDNARALEFYQKSLAMSEEAGNKRLTANALEKIGGTLHAQGNIAQALEYYRRSLQLSEELRNKRGIVFTTNAIGGVHRSQGNYAQAMEYHRRSLQLSEELGNKTQIGTALNVIGVLYFDQGDYAQAMEYFQKGLKLREEIGNAQGVLSSLNNIGEVHRWQGNYAQALEYYQKTLQLSEKIGSKGRRRTALNNIGEVYRAQGNYAQALEHSQKSLALSEELGSQLSIPETLNLIGGIYAAQGDHARALTFAERATAIAKRTGNREQLWNARTVAGQSHRALNDLAKARQAFEEAIHVVESIRAGIVGDKARASYFIKAQKLYELYVDLLMELHQRQPSEGHDAAALQASERARMRSLLEILLESHADIRQGVDPALLDRERTLRQRLNAAAERQTRFLSDKHTPEQAARVQQEVAELTTSLQDVEEQIRLKSPRYAALTQPVPLSLKEIQQLLDPDTLLLEYALGEDRSYLWAVTRTAIKSYELPKRAEIEKSAKAVYSWLTVGYRGERFIGGQRPRPVAGATSYTEDALRLSRMVFAPVAAQLATKRLLIVSDGVLQYIPFAALPDPAARNRQGQAGQPLLVNHEIVNLPSASVLAVLRREFATRAPAPKSVAVLADPVFEEADARVRTAAASNGTTRGGAEPTATKESKVDDRTSNSRFILERALSLQPSIGEDGKVRSGLSISRLPFTRRESAAILAATPKGAGMQSLDFRASRLTATSSDLAQYRIVHFATHGLLNSEHPELSGIILSLVDEEGRPQDGFLRLHEIYNLHLSAELVVLSACQTGLGKEIKGEGLVGLTRGFMYAGSPRVVASLWKVDDVATAELMGIFYQKMLRGKMRPAAALRAAQVEMWRQPRWQSPYYWAAFQLQGEWR